MLGMRNKAGTSKIGKPGVPGSKAVGVAGIVTGVKKKKKRQRGFETTMDCKVRLGQCCGEHRRMRNQRLQLPEEVERRA